MAAQQFVIENGILAANAAANSVFQHNTAFNANVTVTASLLYVGGNLYVSGSQVIVGNNVYDTNIIPLTTGRLIGNTTNQFDASLRYTTIYGSLNPSANAMIFGGPSARWEGYFVDVNASGNLVVSSNTTLNNFVASGNGAISGTLSTGNTTITGTLGISGATNITGNVAITSNTSVTANISSQGYILNNAAFYSNVVSQAMVAATSYTVDAFPKAYSSAFKAYVLVSGASGLHSTQVSVLQDGTNIICEYFGENFNTKLGTFAADINNANVELSFTPATSNTYTVKTLREHII